MLHIVFVTGTAHFWQFIHFHEFANNFFDSTFMKLWIMNKSALRIQFALNSFEYIISAS